jgi:hypothetical protein
MSITIDNKKIEELEIKMRTVYQTWEEMILRKERDRKRKVVLVPLNASPKEKHLAIVFPQVCVEVCISCSIIYIEIDY